MAGRAVCPVCRIVSGVKPSLATSRRTLRRHLVLEHGWAEADAYRKAEQLYPPLPGPVRRLPLAG